MRAGPMGARPMGAGPVRNRECPAAPWPGKSRGVSTQTFEGQFGANFARDKTLDQVEWPVLGLVENPTEILSDHPQRHELYTAEKQDDGHQSRIAGDRIAKYQRLRHDLDAENH